jgi:hypothetical protein
MSDERAFRRGFTHGYERALDDLAARRYSEAEILRYVNETLPHWREGDATQPTIAPEVDTTAEHSDSAEHSAQAEP